MENPYQNDQHVDWKAFPTVPVCQGFYNLYDVGLCDGQFGLTHTVKELYIFLTVFQDWERLPVELGEDFLHLFDRLILFHEKEQVY